MKKALLLFGSLFFALSSQAQYIDSVSVSPVNPNTGTPVTVYVYGYFSSLTTLVSVNHSVNGNVIQVDVERCLGMATAIDNTKDSAAIGLLPAGTYSVNAYLHTASFNMNTGACDTSTVTDSANVVFTVSQTTGIHATASLSSASIYFNANEKCVVVSLPESAQACKVSVFDLSGRAIEPRSAQRSGRTIRIRMETPPGLYLVKLDDGQSAVVKKMVVQ